LEASNDHDSEASDGARDVGSGEELDGVGAASVREGSGSDGRLLGALRIGGVAGISLDARNIDTLVGLFVEVAEVVGQAVDLALVVEALHVGIVVASARLGDALGGPCAAFVVVTNSGSVPESATSLEDTLVAVHAAVSRSIAVDRVERAASVDDAGGRSGSGRQGAARVHSARIDGAVRAGRSALVDGGSGVEVAFSGRALLRGEGLADDFSVGEAASRFNNDGAEASSRGDTSVSTEFADEAVCGSSTSDVEPETLHGDAHLVLAGRVGGLSDDGVVVPVGEGTSEAVAASVGSTTLPERSSVSVSFRSFNPLPEASAVLSTTEPAGGSHLLSDETVFGTGGDGSEVTVNTVVGLLRAELASGVEVTRKFEVAIDVSVGGVVVSTSTSGPSKNALSGSGGSGEVVDGTKDSRVLSRSASTFEAELTEGGEPQLDDTERSSAEVGSEDIHTARVAASDGDGETVDDTTAGLDGGSSEGKDGDTTSDVGSVARSSDVPVAVRVDGTFRLILFSARRSFRHASATNPSAAVEGTVALVLGDTSARVVTSGRALVLVPQAVALLCAVHGGQRSVADADGVFVAGK
jgi:hypothetical protein